MSKAWGTALALCIMSSTAAAQDIVYNDGYTDSIGASEQLYEYDDREPWKHGWIQNMPYYGGCHFFRPYNYKNIYSQSQTAARWGMKPQLAYSQGFFKRYETSTAAPTMPAPDLMMRPAMIPPQPTMAPQPMTRPAPDQPQQPMPETPEPAPKVERTAPSDDQADLTPPATVAEPVDPMAQRLRTFLMQGDTQRVGENERATAGR